MIFADDEGMPPPEGAPASRARPAHELLAACAAEMKRQAVAIGDLDAALGAALLALRDQPGTARPLTTSEIKALQRTDQIRQEVEGLAQALDLVVKAASLTTVLEQGDIEACTPVFDLRVRLLSGP